MRLQQQQHYLRMISTSSITPIITTTTSIILRNTIYSNNTIGTSTYRRRTILQMINIKSLSSSTTTASLVSSSRTTMMITSSTSTSDPMTLSSYHYYHPNNKPYHLKSSPLLPVYYLQQQYRKQWYSTSRIVQDSSNKTTTTDTTTTSTDTNMVDEYSGTATMDEMSYGETYTSYNFQLESGYILPKVQIRYRTYGIQPITTNTTSNVIVICHALTGNASIDTWWSSLLGPNQAFDTMKYHIICCNILGSCYGSTSPISINPQTNQIYGIHFPNITVQDTVKIQLQCLQEQLQLQSILCVIGGSFGGMQTLEYALQGNYQHLYNNTNNTNNNTNNTDTNSTKIPYIQSIIPIACNAQHSAWQIAISEIQRRIIYNDIQWSIHKNYFNAIQGLQLARQLAMISYRTSYGYSNKFGRFHKGNENDDSSISSDITKEEQQEEQSQDQSSLSVPQWEVSNYLYYQGYKFVHQRQFDPITYVKLTQQMDTHDICRNRIPNYTTNTNTNANMKQQKLDPVTNEQNVAFILSHITIPTLILGIDSDILYPIHEQELLAKYIPNNTFYTIQSKEGHDGFLIEQQQVNHYIQQFLLSLS